MRNKFLIHIKWSLHKQRIREGSLKGHTQGSVKGDPDPPSPPLLLIRVNVESSNLDENLPASELYSFKDTSKAMFTSTGQYNFRLGIGNFCIYLFCLHRTILTQYKNLDTYCSKFRMDREQIIEQSHVNEVYSRQTYQQIEKFFWCRLKVAKEWTFY